MNVAVDNVNRRAHARRMSELGLDILDRVAGRPDDQVWYVCHPLRPSKDELTQAAAWGDKAVIVATNFNLQRAKICLNRLRRRFPTITFIAPWITSVEAGGDDSDLAQRELGLRDDCRVIRRCNGVVYCGGRVSDGMRREGADAREIIDLTYLEWITLREA